jgi:hypothetical protein
LPTGGKNGQTTQVAERNGSSGRFDIKRGWFATKAASTPALFDLCGRLSVGDWGVNTEALTMLRGPIRRRPYNRGEIVAKNAKEMGVFYDFY